MTSDLLGAEIATACLPYWEHVLSPLRARLTHEDAVLLAALASGLVPDGPKPLVVHYPRDGEPPAGASVVADRRFTRGRWGRREHRVLALRCTGPDELTGIITKAWAASGNDSLIVVLGAQPAVIDFLQTRFVDDVEANPTNEEGMLRDSAALLSRGWDGLDARIYSRVFGPPELEAALADACAVRREPDPR